MAKLSLKIEQKLPAALRRNNRAKARRVALFTVRARLAFVGTGSPDVTWQPASASAGSGGCLGETPVATTDIP